MTVDLWADRTEIYSQMPQNLQSETLCCPQAKNTPGIDALLCVDSRNFLLQIILGRYRDVKVPTGSGPNPLIQNRHNDLSFIFVVSEGSKTNFACPGKTDQVLAGMPIHLLEIPVK